MTSDRMTMFDKIGKSQTLSQEIVANIEQAIREKKFQVGEKLPTEKELCEMFGVSRTAIREALQMLSAQGLINVHKGKGSFVNDYSSDHVIKPMSLFLELNFDIDYMYHVVRTRRMLEPAVARDAALHRTDDDLKKLKDVLIKFKKTKPSDFEKQGELDREFHLILAKACQNPIIPIITEPIYELMPRIKTLIYEKVDAARSEADVYHEKIYDMIKVQDGDGAYQMMLSHLKIAEDHVNILKEKS